MANWTDYFENKVTDWWFRGQTLTPPATHYIALFKASAGQSPRSTAVTVGQTTIPAAPNGRMYRCTTAGTSGGSEPAWSTTSGGTTTDGTAVWTEMTPDLEANSSNLTAVEVSGGSYARPGVASSLANWAGTQSAGSTTASSGTGGTTSNNASITFATPSASWGLVVGFGLYDAASVGNLIEWGMLTTAKSINSGDSVSYAAGALTTQVDN